MGTRLSANIEDYLETIYLLSRKKRVVRVKDISEEMDVSMPSVNNAVKRLREKGLVAQERYGDVEITPKGIKGAERIYDAHKALVYFFRDILNMDGAAADSDACAIEHYISAGSLKRLHKFVQFSENCSHFEDIYWKKAFDAYCESGEMPAKCSGCAAK